MQDNRPSPVAVDPAHALTRRRQRCQRSFRRTRMSVIPVRVHVKFKRHGYSLLEPHGTKIGVESWRARASVRGGSSPPHPRPGGVATPPGPPRLTSEASGFGVGRNGCARPSRPRIPTRSRPPYRAAYGTPDGGGGNAPDVAPRFRLRPAMARQAGRRLPDSPTGRRP